MKPACWEACFLYPSPSVEHSNNCLLLLCRLFLEPSGHYTNLTTLYTTRWANNVDKITVGPDTVVTTEIAVPTISGYTPIGAIGFSTKQGLSVYQCSVDGQGKVARVYVYNGTSTTVINEIGQAGVHILYLRNFTK